MRLPDRDERRPVTHEAPSYSLTVTAKSAAPSLASAEAEHAPTCRRCGHPLTADESVRRLLGPVCARHEVERVAATLRGEVR